MVIVHVSGYGQTGHPDYWAVPPTTWSARPSAASCTWRVSPTRSRRCAPSPGQAITSPGVRPLGGPDRLHLHPAGRPMAVHRRGPLRVHTPYPSRHHGGWPQAGVMRERSATRLPPSSSTTPSWPRMVGWWAPWT